MGFARYLSRITVVPHRRKILAFYLVPLLTESEFPRNFHDVAAVITCFYAPCDIFAFAGQAAARSYVNSSFRVQDNPETGPAHFKRDHLRTWQLIFRINCRSRATRKRSDRVRSCRRLQLLKKALQERFRFRLVGNSGNYISDLSTHQIFIFFKSVIVHLIMVAA